MIKEKQILQTIYNILVMLDKRKDTRAIINYYLLKTKNDRYNLTDYINLLSQIID